MLKFLLVQQTTASGSIHVAPLGAASEGSLCSSHCQVNIGFVSLSDVRDFLSSCRINRRKSFAAAGIDELVVNE
jgi:hypothetical protein